MSDVDGIFSPGLCRAARGLANWSQAELAKRAHVSRSTVADFERGTRYPVYNNLQALIRTLEEAGVVFVGPDELCGPGVRYANPGETG